MIVSDEVRQMVAVFPLWSSRWLTANDGSTSTSTAAAYYGKTIDRTMQITKKRK